MYSDAPSAALTIGLLQYSPYDWAPRIQCAGAYTAGTWSDGGGVLTPDRFRAMAYTSFSVGATGIIWFDSGASRWNEAGFI